MYKICIDYSFEEFIRGNEPLQLVTLTATESIYLYSPVNPLQATCPTVAS